jgi:hypothetical protein
MWAVKTPKGKLITSSARDSRSDAIMCYVSTQVDLGYVKHVPEYRGPDYFTKMWALFTKNGYQIVRVNVEMRQYSAWSWPELIQV